MNLPVVVYANNLWSSFCSFWQKKNDCYCAIFSKDSGEIHIIKKIEICESVHRGLKLDGAICQGEICNSLKSEIFWKSFLSHIGKNKIKF